MTINVRTKGQQGEREVCKILNELVQLVRQDSSLPQYAKEDEPFQRNQNQSAVGGSDITNPFGLEIEVKRQEQLSVNTWWKQCVYSAARTRGIPILIYKQNRKKWNICMYGSIPLVKPGAMDYKEISQLRVTIDLDSFKQWFIHYYKGIIDAEC